MAPNDTETVLHYHAATKHSERSVRASRHFLDWENKPLPFKVYRDLAPAPLEREIAERDVSALDAIARSPERREPGGDRAERVPDTAALARVLYLAAGITKVRRHAGGEVYFRAYPNTGALHHVDLYLATRALPAAAGGVGLPAGVYHFAPHDFALRRLREGDFRRVLQGASGASPDLARAPLVVASASTYWRNAWKYQARAWRHAFWDAGTLHANLLAAAETEGLDPRVVLGWADAPVQELLGLDAATEGVLALVALGHCAEPPPPSPDPKPLHLETEPLSAERVDYPAIRSAQAASALADAAQARAWREAAEPVDGAQPAPAGALIPLRPAAEGDLLRASLDRVVRRRGSTRAFDATRSLGFEALSTALDRATRGVPGDWLAPGASLLDLYLVVNAVEGLAPGAYHFRRDAGALECLAEGDFRRTAGRLALGQQLAADAAVCCYSLVSLERVLERHGARGYRAAQLEGGITGGRLYLAAYAQGFGATGLTFFDDEVVEFFSPHAAGKSVMFLTALGHANKVALGLAARA